jgi:flavin-dependent dehydrogenase
MSEAKFDVIIIGGGPAGATSALVLARAGFKVLVLEKATFPRFHIGESILPFNLPLIQKLGLEPALRQLPHLPKLGAEFVMGDDEKTAVRFGFSQGLLPGSPTFNIERAAFDDMLLRSAAEAGALVRQGAGVDRITRLADEDVAVESGDETFTARYLLDASGQNTFVGRHLGVRKNVTDPNLRRVAYFGHFENVQHRAHEERGHPAIVFCDEGWFWLIGLNQSKTSVGFVTRPDFAQRVGVPANQVLQWAISRCPVVRQRMKDATGSRLNSVIADFSYRCEPFAGPGYFLLGDAAVFIDPIFSTGVTLAMVSGSRAAEMLVDVLRGQLPAQKAREKYIRLVKETTGIFFRLIRGSYRHSFRELFLNGSGPLQMHKAVISVLAGNVFPRPIWALRWRVRLFEVCVQLQRCFSLVPHVKTFSLLGEKPTELPERNLQLATSVA